MFRFRQDQDNPVTARLKRFFYRNRIAQRAVIVRDSVAITPVFMTGFLFLINLIAGRHFKMILYNAKVNFSIRSSAGNPDKRLSIFQTHYEFLLIDGRRRLPCLLLRPSISRNS